MNWLGWLSGQDTQKNIDHAASGIDKIFFTKEEKAEFSQKVVEIKVKAAATQSIPRRVIATVTVVIWATLILLGVAAKGLNADAFSTYVFDVLKDTVSQPHSIIVGFYFLKEVVGGMFSRNK